MMLEAIDRTAYAPVYEQNKTLSIQQSGAFSQLLNRVTAESSRLPASNDNQRTAVSGRLQGDYLSSFEILNPTAEDRHAQPKGMGASAAIQSGASEKTIDKTSELYQQALEFESYFVKIMLDSMRSTLGNTSLTGKNSFAGKMYEDMMYEELSRTVTKNAGLGLADQIYLQLVN